MTARKTQKAEPSGQSGPVLKTGRAKGKLKPGLCSMLYAASAGETASFAKAGIPARAIDQTAGSMAAARKTVTRMLRISAGNAGRKISAGLNLSASQSLRLAGLLRIIGMAETIAEQSGDGNFDAARWFGEWSGKPVPALGGKPPALFMGTAAGQSAVEKIIAAMQSGAYA